ELPAAGKELRKPVAHLLLQLRHRHGLATRGWDAEQRASRGRVKENDAVRAPCTTAIGGIGDRLRRSTGEVDPLQLGPIEKANRPAVGRPEGIASAFSSRQRLCRRLVE